MWKNEVGTSRIMRESVITSRPSAAYTSLPSNESFEPLPAEGKRCRGGEDGRSVPATASIYLHRHSQAGTARPAPGPTFSNNGPRLPPRWAPLLRKLRPIFPEDGPRFWGRPGPDAAGIRPPSAPYLSAARAGKSKKQGFSLACHSPFPTLCFAKLGGGSGKQKQKTSFFFGLSLALH